VLLDVCVCVGACERGTSGRGRGLAALVWGGGAEGQLREGAAHRRRPAKSGTAAGAFGSESERRPSVEGGVPTWLQVGLNLKLDKNMLCVLPIRYFVARIPSGWDKYSWCRLLANNRFGLSAELEVEPVREPIGTDLLPDFVCL